MQKSRKWNTAKLPGSYYALNQDKIFPITNQWGIPELQRITEDDIDLSLPFLEYRSRDREGICHFFLDDYRFEATWNAPVKALKCILSYKGTLTPDFSLFTDWPLSMQIWNIYRSRWCGALWQEKGQKVIPTIGWSTPESYDFCFVGIPKDSLVAVAYGSLTNKDESASLFVEGYKEMLRQLEPRKVLVYGKLFPEELRDDRVLMVDTFWQRKNKQVLKVQ